MERLAACFEGSDEAAQRDCISRELQEVGPPPPEDLGAWVCSRLDEIHANRAVFEGILAMLGPHEVLEYCDSVTKTCPDVGMGYTILDSVAAVCELDRSWCGTLQALLDSESMFGESHSTSTLRIAHRFAQKGDDWARYLLEEAPRGTFDATGEQAQLAAHLAFDLRREGEPARDYIASVLEGTKTPADTRMGCFLAAMLMREHSWGEGGLEESLLLCERVLQDGRFQLDAALQLQDYVRRGLDAPGWISPSQWAALVGSPTWTRITERVLVLLNP